MTKPCREAKRTPEQAELARVLRFLHLAREQSENLPAQPYGLELHERINGLIQVVAREMRPQQKILDAAKAKKVTSS